MLCCCCCIQRHRYPGPIYIASSCSMFALALVVIVPFAPLLWVLQGPAESVITGNALLLFAVPKSTDILGRSISLSRVLRLLSLSSCLSLLLLCSGSCKDQQNLLCSCSVIWPSLPTHVADRTGAYWRRKQFRQSRSVSDRYTRVGGHTNLNIVRILASMM